MIIGENDWKTHVAGFSTTLIFGLGYRSMFLCSHLQIANGDVAYSVRRAPMGPMGRTGLSLGGIEGKEAPEACAASVLLV